MLQGSSKPKKEPKASFWLSILSLVSFAGAYFMLRQEMDADEIKLLGIRLEYDWKLFFVHPAHRFVTRLLKKNRLFSGGGVNLLWVSELTYKMKDYARMFFMITIVTAITCTAAGAVLALNKQMETVYKEDPFAFGFYPLTNATGKTEMARVERELKRAGIRYEKVGLKRSGSG